MKANFKKTFTAIAVTVMCAVPMTGAATANAETYRTFEAEPAYAEFELADSRQMISTTPVIELERPRTKYTLPPRRTEVTFTYVDPLTDPIKDDWKMDKRYYADSVVRTTRTEVNMDLI